MKINEKSLTERTVYYDYLRIIATIAVITLHVVGLYWGDVDVNSKEWLAFNFYDSIMRWGVPVFVMISGALFLSKNEISTKVIFSKYVLRIVTAFAAWSFIYFLYQKVKSQSNL